MAFVVPDDERRCHAKSKQSGTRCRRPVVMEGARVCYIHGGASPLTRQGVEKRLAAMVNPALDALRELIDTADSDSVRLSAIKDILDRSGYKPVLQPAADTDTPTLNVTVRFDRPDDDDQLALSG